MGGWHFLTVTVHGMHVQDKLSEGHRKLPRMSITSCWRRVCGWKLHLMLLFPLFHPLHTMHLHPRLLLYLTWCWFRDYFCWSVAFFPTSHLTFFVLRLTVTDKFTQRLKAASEERHRLFPEPFELTCAELKHSSFIFVFYSVRDFYTISCKSTAEVVFLNKSVR